MMKGAIFDLDGTILDSMPVWEDAGERYLKRLGVTAEADLGTKLFSMSMREGADYLKGRYRLSFTIDEIIGEINGIIRDFYIYEVPLKPGVKQFLTDMKEYGIKMTLATASDREVVIKALERLGIHRLFDGIFTCGEVGTGKTKPDIYYEAAKFMGLAPKDIWVFEDALYAVITAKEAGFVTVGIYDETSRDEQERIREVCDSYLSEFSDFHVFIKDRL